jgi:NAD(P)H-hydrate repair Nnr-like enzyme with NAD(P)H-hydrate dehydratase domain
VVETVPTAGLTDQVTAVLDEPVTVAVNWLVWETVSDAVAGFTDTLTGGARAMLALADLVGSAALVAMTVTVCALEIEAGAV